VKMSAADGDAIVGTPTLESRICTTHVCHNCDQPIACVRVDRLDEHPGSGNKKKKRREEKSGDIHVCKGCGFARYCDERCAARAWKMGHHLTCGHIARRLGEVADQKV
jgi:hypothetical protein